ncbi:hypothetical protein TWF225_009369 [Orbilia oligospora]|uniref:Uncharacterized protein n=1 Tax=Orbilia oligospora TaxID=2813651 RepID=A0A7C8TWL5_ORBOL|nr:hypothetical protein TWF751_001941 [Orbilia oligospora]KAF3193827.1 hypothetical protein TWF225_009369 [Orbilia oligospora]KAF3270010.1 hypothetical protein TWF217_008353 [Orbilia oligospora]KAF3270478.1 hypothetical protein TWF128_004244 [Orbilia oligospora]KAF3298039.1 hypothetical protein TWF132_004181 [Orbilia oligospora]
MDGIWKVTEGGRGFGRNRRSSLYIFPASNENASPVTRGCRKELVPCPAQVDIPSALSHAGTRALKGLQKRIDDGVNKLRYTGTSFLWNDSRDLGIPFDVSTVVDTCISRYNLFVSAVEL